jgi:ATP-dependent RNA helicase DDX35
MYKIFADCITVIDCGFVKMRWFNPETHADSLVVVPVSQASADQRAGRAGRICSGKAYRYKKKK